MQVRPCLHRCFSAILLLLFVLIAPVRTLAQHHDEPAATEVTHAAEHADHDAGLVPLFFIILALIIGAATRHLLKKSPIPFTVLLFVFGLVLGVMGRDGIGASGLSIFDMAPMSLDLLDNAVQWAANIDPHLLLYVFLPILIFEAAFAMDVHTFKKTVVNATLLAVPGIVIALLLTGAIAIGLQAAGLGLNGWNWPIAFMFGAVVSATDPVAVVAILKGLGASKKLGTLIEGESLLNDGTAIVFFMVFFLGLTGAGGDGSPIIDFLYVGLGGIVIGLAIGWLAARWVKRVFNDALIEICVIIAAAYLTFFVAEHTLHVSGVLALVSLGLMMAGPGRTSLSPEVEHFLHEFWDLAVFIANILIFLIVGVVIAYRTIFTADDFILLGLIYLGIFVVRAIVIVVLYPFMKRFGYGINKPFAIVAWWGALRGAIGLALALIVANAPELDEEIRNQFLFLVAGIVLATLLINATTMEWLVHRLGLTRIPTAKAAMIASTYKFLHSGTENALSDIRNDRFMRSANWKVVEQYKPNYDAGLAEIQPETTVAEIRRRVLEKEKNSYWRQFKDGMLGGVAVRNLSDQIDDMLDKGGKVSLSERADLELAWQTPKLLTRFQSVPFLRGLSQDAFFNRLAIAYECARGFVTAQEETVKLLSGIQRTRGTTITDAETAELAALEDEINTNRIHGLTFLRNMRKAHPDIYNAIATRQAIRSMLNYERATVNRLLKKGRIEKDEASKLLSSIEQRMKQLLDKPPMVEKQALGELMDEVPWFKTLNAAARDFFEQNVEERVFAVGDVMLEQAKKGSGLLVIVHGSANVVRNGEAVYLLGAGELAGELSSLTGNENSASVVAQVPVTALWIKEQYLLEALNKFVSLEHNLWSIAANRIAHNLLADVEPFAAMDSAAMRTVLHDTLLTTGDALDKSKAASNLWILVAGSATSNRVPISAPAILPHDGNIWFDKARVLVVPMP